eukprot:GILK01001426.1.p1 GENE.GILK01001426.1~~GILK01001426.1.p1  ORF type:complete len:347 (+),score=49.98 GILK01001426.1:54-1094(+)
MSSPKVTGVVNPTLPPNWFEAHSEDGRIYYYNSITNEVTWEKPANPNLNSSLMNSNNPFADDVFTVNVNELGDLSRQTMSTEETNKTVPLSAVVDSSSRIAPSTTVTQSSSSMQPIPVGSPTAAPQLPEPKGCTAFCQIRFYQKYFDVTSEDVFGRLARSVWPFNRKFFEASHENPDLYGPFWIYTTLIIMMAAAGNVSSYLQAADRSAWNYDFNYMPVAAAVVYGFGFIFPLVLWFIISQAGSKTSFVQVVCIYGYSLFVFVPITIFAVIPSEVFRWIIVVFGLALSLAFLLGNLWREMDQHIEKKKYMVLGFVLGAQIGLILTYKLVFFGYIGLKASDSTDNLN